MKKDKGKEGNGKSKLKGKEYENELRRLQPTYATLRPG